MVRRDDLAIRRVEGVTIYYITIDLLYIPANRSPACQRKQLAVWRAALAPHRHPTDQCVSYIPGVVRQADVERGRRDVLECISGRNDVGRVAELVQCLLK